jgi:hypothetical protein
MGCKRKLETKGALETTTHSHDLLGQQLGAKKRLNFVVFLPNSLSPPQELAHCEGHLRGCFVSLSQQTSHCLCASSAIFFFS